MSFISIKPLPFQYRVHFNGAGYYYTSEQGERLHIHYLQEEIVKTDNLLIKIQD